MPVDHSKPKKTMPISLEFFPPKTEQGWQKLKEVRQELYGLKPEFCSVTFGAGGSTQDGTLQAIKEILSEGVSGAPHLSCIGASKESLLALLKQYQSIGAKKIVALRGDLPSGYGLGGEFMHANELIAFIRQEMGDAFSIETAAYPEIHPQAKSPQDDIQNFVRKVKAGADSAITQYFFNADAYFRFVDEVKRHGVDIPIVPGIMPIINSTQLMRFSQNCGAEIPRWIALRLAGFGDDMASIKAFGTEVVAQLCEQLIAGGAPGLHFYTMNQSKPVLDIMQKI